MLVQQVINDPETAEISNKLKAILKIAAKVQQDGKKVPPSEFLHQIFSMQNNKAQPIKKSMMLF